LKPIFQNQIDTIVKIFPILTALTFIYGYIGFHTFTAIYHLPIISTDISIIASIGLLNLIYIGILYSTATYKRAPRLIEAFLIYWIFTIVLHNPATLAAIVVVLLVSKVFSVEKTPKKLLFSKRKENAKWYKKHISTIDVIAATIGALVSFLISENFYTLTLTIYVLLHLIHKYKRYNQKPIFLSLLVILSFPMITMYYFINSSEVNIIGLNSQEVNITTTSDTLNTKFVFSDDTFYYCYTDSNKQVFSVRKDNIRKIISTSERNKNATGYFWFKKLYHKIRD